MRTIGHIIIAALMCCSALECWGQTYDLGCDDATWNRLCAIKNHVDNGKGFDCIGELERINDSIYKSFTNDGQQIPQALTMSTSTLAELFIEKGECHKADSLMSRYNLLASSLEYSNEDFFFQKNYTVKESIPYRQLFYAQGFLFFYLGDLEKAQKSLEFAKELYVTENDVVSVDYIKCLLLLIDVLNLGDENMTKMHLYWKQASSAYRKLDNNNAYLQAWLTYCQGLINYALGQEENAKKKYNEVLAFQRENDFNYKYIVTGSLCYIIIIDNGGEENLKRALQWLNEVDDPFRKMSLIYIITNYADRGVDKQSLLDQFNALLSDAFNKQFSYFSLDETEALWTEYALTSLFVNNIMATQGIAANSTAYNNVLFTKSFLIKRDEKLREIKNRAVNNQAVTMYNQLSGTLSNEQNVLYSSVNKYYLSKREKDIIKDNLLDWNRWINGYNPRCEDIKSALGPHDVAIEFSFIVDSLYTDSVESYFCAYVLRNADGYPKMVKLGDCSELVDIFDVMSKVEQDEDEKRLYINDLYKSDKLYHMLWEPIEKEGHVFKGDTIYYSPAINIHKINLEAIVRKANGVCLMDDYVFKKVLSTYDIINLKRPEETLNLKDMRLYGDIDYNTSSSQEMAQAEMEIEGAPDNMQVVGDYAQTNHVSQQQVRERTSRDRSFKKLDEAGYEVDAVANFLDLPKSKILKGKMATEESFKSLTGDAVPEVIHIATHGVFMSGDADRQMSLMAGRRSSSKKNEEMIYSGLAFSGVNNAWMGNPVHGIEDGFLSAEEVSWMDLRKCKLVVLSACETGLGTVDVVDGILGLQRGFRLAGVDKILMSLWTVDDEATSELMKEFYKQLADGKTCHDALDGAKKRLRTEKINEKDYSAPYYWAGFVLLE